jgi:hypothetical protein
VPSEHQSDARFVDILRLDASEMQLPPGVHGVIPENHSRVHVTLRKVIEKRLTVRLNHTGDDRVEQVVVEPSTVIARGPKEILEREEFIPTQLYTVKNLPAGAQPYVMEDPDCVPLVSEIGGRAIRVAPAQVAVRFTLRPRQKVLELVDVPVHFLCPNNFPYRPQFTSERAGQITLRVQGPATQGRPNVAAYVDLTHRKFGQGLHAEEPIQVQLPAGFQLAQEPPRLSSFKLVPLDGLAKSGEGFVP